MKYTKQNNTYFATPKDNPKDRIEIEIGDSKQPDFKPQLKIIRWDNEVNASFRFIDNDPELPQVSKDGENIKYVKSKREVHFYDKPDTSEDGGYEFEVILNDKPYSNVLEFSIETKELDFFYQPPLTQQEIDEGVNRPVNAIGSYAVYHKTKGGMNDSAGMEYKVGKAFHIYRPKIIDAEGTEIWGELNIDEQKKLLTVTIPQDFLNNAVYPVVVDPTFGYTTIGGSGKGGVNYMYGYRFSVPADYSSLTKVTFCSWNEGGATVYKKAVIVNTSKNIVTNGVSNAVALTGTEFVQTWYDATFSSAPSISASTDYYLSTIGNSSNTFFFDSGTTNYGYEDSSNSYTTPTNPTDGSYTFNTKFSIYATYTATASDLSVNVSDNINVSENVTSWNSNQTTSIYDSANVTENIAIIEQNLIVSVFDSISVSEDITAQSSPQSINIFDTVNVSEDITVSTSSLPLEINVYDSITVQDVLLWFPDTVYVRESVTVEIIGAPTELSINVSDDVSVSENITSTVPLVFINVYDSVQISESVTLEENLYTISVFDSIEVSESIDVFIPGSGISKSDNINVSEDLTILEANLPTSITDNVNVSENVSVFLPSLTINVYDGISVSEAITTQVPLDFIDVYDSVEVSEAIISEVQESVFTISVYDGISVSEAITIEKQDWIREISTFDGISISESVTILQAQYKINVYDSLRVSENISAETNLLSLSVFNSIVVSESTSQIIIGGWFGIGEASVPWSDTSDVSSSWTQTTEASTPWNATSDSSTSWTEGSDSSTPWTLVDREPDN